MDRGRREASSEKGARMRARPFLRVKKDQVVTRTELDAAGQAECHEPECSGDHMLHPDCHGDSLTEVIYGHGVLTLLCGKCKRAFLAVRVAAGAN